MHDRIRRLEYCTGNVNGPTSVHSFSTSINRIGAGIMFTHNLLLKEYYNY